mmetsp:Transcript_26700/g.70119  ORF Transcript_26700/g.70119 Transcript_26700/m.70119 type:complete len:276 (+) Transcript_26700:925-1752(+)
MIRIDEYANTMRTEVLRRVHLRPGVDLLLHRARRRVPEADAAVRRAAPRSQQLRLVRRPRQRLDRRLVVRDAVARGLRRPLAPERRGQVPDAQQVVVAARRQLRARGRPAQPADLLRVGAVQLADEVLGRARVVVGDGAVARAAREKAAAVPRQGAHPHLVAPQRADLPQRGGVPELDLGVVRAHGQPRAVRRPGHGGDVVALPRRLAELLDGAGGRVPQVHRGPQRNGEDIAGRPVEQVEVIVVHQLGRVQNFVRCHRDVSGCAPRGAVVWARR